MNGRILFVMKLMVFLGIPTILWIGMVWAACRLLELFGVLR